MEFLETAVTQNGCGSGTSEATRGVIETSSFGTVMNIVTLQPDGSVFESRRHLSEDPLEFLGYKVEIAERATLRTFFKMVIKYPLLARLNPFLPTYIKHYGLCAEKDCVYPDMDYLELDKTVEMIGFPGEPRLEIYITLHGVKENEKIDLKDIGLDSLLDMPLKLGKLKHVVMGDKVDIFEFDTVFTFFEFIDGIVWELSFLGTLTGCPLRR
jgi:hypothetical protein